ncbi:alpha/beta fold hydrolase [Halobium salinum]|uniref:Alpha/beta fold hydrolase n=1 Tax=Halobium salinum TaxID=1364940 RepID=A0ABD5PAV6_9EURY|nr:alpha/beta fold hydrolase [Halobium salinum]
MQFDAFGDPDDTPLLFPLGWGNRPDHENVAWLVDRLVDAGYHVHTATIPTTVTDFERAYLRPVARYADANPPAALLSHSTGGLIAAHLDRAVPRVYLSPWWGIAGGTGGLRGLLLRLPTARSVLPVPTDGDAIGDLATDRQLREGPDGIAPAFLRTVHEAQKRLPPLREDSVVFCTLTDQVVSVRAIGERTPASRVRVYDGGHEFFSSSGRGAVADRVIDALSRSDPGAV